MSLFAPPNQPLSILWRDPTALVVNKPHGLLTQAAAGLDSVQARLRIELQESSSTQMPYVGMPHRLDRPVTGCLLVGLTQRATNLLSRQFEARRVEKRYLGLIPGRPETPSGRWEDWMRKVPELPRSELVDPQQPGAQLATLDYRVIESDSSWSLVEFLPQSGRMHQIRLQCASRELPLWGDLLYGSKHSFGPPTEDPRELAIALHAWRLSFRHPQTGRAVTVSAPPPELWRAMGPAWLGQITVLNH